MKQLSQAELLALIEGSRQGNRAAQDALMQAVQKRIYYHCKKMLKNEEDALDATQDVLIVIFTSLDKLKEPTAFWGWVNGITANRCRHLLSAPHKEWQIPEDEDGNSMLDNIEDLDRQSVPEQALDDQETRRMILGLVDGLPPDQRMSVLYYYYDEMSVKQIAEAMEVSEGTVKSRLNYARKAIKRGAEEYERKGVKLYSVSPMILLACFLRLDAEATSLSAASAAAIAESVGGAMSGAAVSAAATGGGAGTAASAAGAGAKAGAVISKKLVAGVLAGAVAVGGVGVGITALVHQDDYPTQVATISSGAASSAAGFIDVDGSLWVWGTNVPVDGSLGQSAAPTVILEDVACAGFGTGFGGAVKTDGSLWMWGSNLSDQLGVGGQVYSAEAPVKLMDDVAAVSCGSGFAQAVKTDGSLWGWGTDTVVGLGNGADRGSSTPIKIMDDVAAVSCGTQFGAIIKADGSLWMWGRNGDGQLGTGDTAGTLEPVKVMENVDAVSCGGTYGNNFTAALQTDGSLWMWGFNEGGQLGIGTRTSSVRPVKVMEDVVSVSCGELHTVAVKKDGTVWAWGGNLYGQLGTGDQENYDTPVQVMEDVVSAACGADFTLAVRADSTVWAWGSNTGYTLGRDDLHQSSLPVQIQFARDNVTGDS